MSSLPLSRAQLLADKPVNDVALLALLPGAALVPLSFPELRPPLLPEEPVNDVALGAAGKELLAPPDAVPHSALRPPSLSEEPVNDVGLASQ